MHAERLARSYPTVQVEPDVLYLDDGDILTTAGTASGIDLCLHIVRTDYGTAVANDLARRLVTAPHRPGGQAQFIPGPAPQHDGQLGELLAWATGHLDQPLTVADLARRVNMSSRTLTRHFAAVTGTTPRHWLLTQRIHRAQELLETPTTASNTSLSAPGSAPPPASGATSTASSASHPASTGATSPGRSLKTAPHEAQPQRYETLRPSRSRKALRRRREDPGNDCVRSSRRWIP